MQNKTSPLLMADELPNVDPTTFRTPEPPACYGCQRLSIRRASCCFMGRCESAPSAGLPPRRRASPRGLRARNPHLRSVRPAAAGRCTSRPSEGPGVARAVAWSEGQVWCSPERHGTMTGIMKAQIDWIPLSLGAVRPTQGKTLAVMQSERRFAVLQRRQPTAGARPLDAHDHDPEPVIGGEGL